MHATPRSSLLNVANVMLVAMIVLLLGGCVTTPPPRKLHGDFIMNIGSTAPVPALPEVTTKFATAANRLGFSLASVTPRVRGS